jgi:hypothetical protein
MVKAGTICKNTDLYEIVPKKDSWQTFRIYYLDIRNLQEDISGMDAYKLLAFLQEIVAAWDRHDKTVLSKILKGDWWHEKCVTKIIFTGGETSSTHRGEFMLDCWYTTPTEVSGCGYGIERAQEPWAGRLFSLKTSKKNGNEFEEFFITPLVQGRAKLSAREYWPIWI